LKVSGRFKVRSFSLGIRQLDEALGGGIPHPNLISIEGGHGTGKTAIGQQIVYSVLRGGLTAWVVTAETRILEYLSMMRSIRLDPYSYFIAGRLSIYPLHIKSGRWSRQAIPLLLNVLDRFLDKSKDRYDLVLVDSLSLLTTEASHNDFLTFITRVKNIVSAGKTVVLTFHPGFVPEELLVEVKASSDTYLVLRNVTISGMNVKALEIVKMWGTSGDRKGPVTLEINPSLGLRVVPLGGVKI